jgi:peptidase E
MIRFFLHGGRINAPSKQNELLFEKILSCVEEEARILIIPFARKSEFWEEKFEITKKQFLEKCERKILHFSLAEVDILPQQIENSDIIFIH